MTKQTNALDFMVDTFCALQTPRIQLSEHVQCTDEFRKEYNEWLAKEFGYDIDFTPLMGYLF